ncbi:hypothetical protein QQ14_18645 [Salmonella enterica subsp. enterica]|uniref:Uncharacterized protein n=1 Tax=Salmonella enterica TaxID=28901 RepID=A0A3R0Q223_SALER|nr:hypothetical protein [Salmonella enterica]EBH8127046.1 hypothetical protein [Salmonella enterica subsp. houtenae serovar O:11:g,z25:-]ECB1323398.1 hypothetical protein [Salmonella enterica subsp. enterica serovar Panama]ECD9291055.1 hypothetical protein [Salmonella enterica subsp. houtenae]ECH8281718.1 hypothetical protein [Salmonella enterica subsp. enterica]
MSDTDLLYSGPGTVMSEKPVLTPHNLQILQWMIQPASEGLLILSGPVSAKSKAPEGTSGELHV